MCVYIPLFSYYLPAFVIAIYLGCTFCFSVLYVCFNTIYCHNKPPVESLFLAIAQALRLWSGCADSKSIDYQRTSDPREYQIVRTHTKATTYVQDLAPPNCQWHPGCLIQTANKTKRQTQPSADRVTTSPSHAHQREHKHKSQPTWNTNHWTNLTRAETKRKKEVNIRAWEKEASNTLS